MTNVIDLNDVEKILEIFKALSCKTRFDIVVTLIRNKECHVGEMAEKLKIPQPNISQHLTILKSAGIIEGFRNGTQIFYRVTNKRVEKIVKALEVA